MTVQNEKFCSTCEHVTNGHCDIARILHKTELPIRGHKACEYYAALAPHRREGEMKPEVTMSENEKFKEWWTDYQIKFRIVNDDYSLSTIIMVAKAAYKAALASVDRKKIA